MSIIENRPSTLEYRQGAFSCWLCLKTFNKELILMGNNVCEMHMQSHQARFLSYVFSKEEITHAFYEHARREKAMLDISSL